MDSGSWTGGEINPKESNDGEKEKNAQCGIKAKEGLEALRGDEPVHVIARLRQVHPLQVSACRKDVSENRKRVRRLMAAMGIEAIYRQPNLSKEASTHPAYPYLLRKLAVVRSDHV